MILPGPIAGHAAGDSLIALKYLADGREVCLLHLTFGRSRLTVGRRGSWVYDDSW